MPKSSKIWLMIVGLSGALSVALGAYGWHALDDSQPHLRDSFNIGVQYQMWHTLALIGVAWLCKEGAVRMASLAGLLFCVGMILFSGSLYYFATTATLLINGAAPAGGVVFMVGWVVFGISALKRPPV